MLLISVGFGQHSLASNITLLKASEVDEIFEGNDERYKALTVSSDVVYQRSSLYFFVCFISLSLSLLLSFLEV